MRVAYVHDWLIVDGGAEKVAAAILEVYPQADVFSLIDFLSPEDRQTIIRGKHATTSFIQKLPQAKKRYRNYLPLFPRAIQRLDVSDYDLVISSSYSVAKGVRTHARQLHICYCHTPIRYAWNLRKQYLDDAGISGGVKGWLANKILDRIRDFDQRTAKDVDHFIANSQNVAQRIQDFYKREATVIHPPVDASYFVPGAAKSDFYLTAARLVPYKKTSLIVQAFAQLPDSNLVVIGDGPEYEELTQMAPSNVTLLGAQPNDVLRDYLQRAKAFVVAAEEDFGITPLEAQASGTPVIAYGKGGYLETVVAEKTGIFFEMQHPDSIRDAILTFERKGVNGTATELHEHALSFSKDAFMSRFQEFVEAKLDAFNRG